MEYVQLGKLKVSRFIVARTMRAGDMVCVGIYQKDKPDMLKTDIDLLHAALAAAGGRDAKKHGTRKETRR